MTLALEDLAGDVEGYPSLSSQNFETTAIVSSGGVYLLGAINREDQQDDRSGPLQLRKQSNRSAELLQVWCRVYRVGAPNSFGK